MFYYEFLLPCRLIHNGTILKPGYYSLDDGKGPASITYTAARIWKETNEGIMYAKNQGDALPQPVELSEFAWIKLKAKPLRDFL